MIQSYIPVTSARTAPSPLSASLESLYWDSIVKSVAGEVDDSNDPALSPRR